MLLRIPCSIRHSLFYLASTAGLLLFAHDARADCLAGPSPTVHVSAADLASTGHVPHLIQATGYQGPDIVATAIGSDQSCTFRVHEGWVGPDMSTDGCREMFATSRWGTRIAVAFAAPLRCDAHLYASAALDLAVETGHGTYQITETAAGDRELSISVDMRSELEELVVPAPRGPWTRHSIHDGHITIPQSAWFDVAGLFGEQVAVFATTSTRHVYLLQLSRRDTPLVARGSGRHEREGEMEACLSSVDDGWDMSDGSLPSWCTSYANHHRFSGHQPLCFDATTGSIIPVSLPGRDTALPNRGFVVVVRHCRGQSLEIAMDGVRGLTSGSTLNVREAQLQRARDDLGRVAGATTPRELKERIGQNDSDLRTQLGRILGDDADVRQFSALVSRFSSGTEVPTQEELSRMRSLARTIQRQLAGENVVRQLADEDVVRYAVQPFGPRQPGVADLRIRAGGGSEHRVELTIVEQRWAAVRVGLGLPFGNDLVPPSYRVASAPDSTVRFVQRADEGAVALELVLGISPFVFDILAWGGRNDERGENARVAPFFGVGLSSVAATGLDAFTSVYLGLELEFLPEVSVAPCLVIRRTHMLGAPYVENGPIDQDSAPLQDGVGFGFGLVVNVAPDVFQITPPTIGASDHHDEPVHQASPQTTSDEGGSE